MNGYEIDTINTVNFSNHTGYPVWKGEVLSGDQLWTIFQGLRENGLLDGYTHLLTGYVRSASCLERLSEMLDVLRQANPNLIYVCDPVMGDDGKLYVPQENVAVFRRIIPRADYLFPNQTEAEMLTDMKISDERTAFACIDKLHDASVSLVVITSAVLGDDRDTLHIFGSWRPRGAATERFRLSVKRLPHPFIGTGDLLAALLMVRMWENLHNNASASLTVDDDSRATNAAARAVESSIASLQSVLARTLAGAANRDPRKLPTTPELALLESVDAVRHPTITIFAKRVTIQ